MKEVGTRSKRTMTTADREFKAFAIEMSRDPREGLTARQRAMMACIVIPAEIQKWMVEAGAVEPLLDSLEKTILAAEAAASPASGHIDIVLDGPPGPEAGRFVEVENDKGESISIGQWVQRPDGCWALRIAAPASVTVEFPRAST